MEEGKGVLDTAIFSFEDVQSCFIENLCKGDLIEIARTNMPEGYALSSLQMYRQKSWIDKGILVLVRLIESDKYDKYSDAGIVQRVSDGLYFRKLISFKDIEGQSFEPEFDVNTFGSGNIIFEIKFTCINVPFCRYKICQFMLHGNKRIGVE